MSETHTPEVPITENPSETTVPVISDSITSIAPTADNLEVVASIASEKPADPEGTTPAAPTTEEETLEVPADSSEPADVSPENEAAAESKEVTPERQQQEFIQIGETILHQEAAKIKRGLWEKQISLEKLTDAQRAVLLLESVNELGDAGFIDLSEDKSQNHPAIKCVYGGREGTIVSLNGYQDGNFKARVMLEGNEVTVSIPKNEVIQSFLTIYGDSIAESLEGNTREVLKRYLDSSVNNEAITTTPEDNSLLAETAKERGILTHDDMLSFLISSEGNRELSEDEKKAISILEEQAKSSNIIIESEIDKLISDLGLDEIKNESKALIQITILGELPADQSKLCIEAMRRGDVHGAIDVVNQNDPDKQRVLRRRQRLENCATYGLIGLGAILLAMWELAVLESKELNKSLK